MNSHRRAGCLLKSAEPEIPGSRPPLQLGFHLSPAQRGASAPTLGAGCCIPTSRNTGRYACRQRHPIYAVADGVVSAASARPSYGNCVQIDHGTADDGSSYATLYAHMSSFCVSAGQTVHKGDDRLCGQHRGCARCQRRLPPAFGAARINGTCTDPLQYIPH